MPIFIKQNNIWKEAKELWVKRNDHWHPIIASQDDYEWAASEWSTCTAECGGGIQERDVWCHNPITDETYEDSVCELAIGLKPETIRNCNIEPCLDCRYVVNNSAWWAVRWSDGESALYIMFDGVWLVNAVFTPDAFTKTEYIHNGIKYRRGELKNTTGGVPNQAGSMEWAICKEIYN